MSFVIGFATPQEVIIMSDGRARNSLSREILSESYNKTRKINNNVCIGFSGIAEVSECIIDNFMKYPEINIDIINADDTAVILCEIAKIVASNVNADNIQMVIAGLDASGKITLNSFAKCTGFQINKQIPTISHYCYATLNPNGFDGDKLFEHYICLTQMSITKRMENCIKHAAQLNDTINNRVFKCKISK